MSHLPRWIAWEHGHWHSLQIPPASCPCIWWLCRLIPLAHALLSHRPDVSIASCASAIPKPDNWQTWLSLCQMLLRVQKVVRGRPAWQPTVPKSQQKARLEGSGRTERSAVGAVDRLTRNVRGRLTIVGHLAGLGSTYANPRCSGIKSN